MTSPNLEALLELMERLRGPGGCPWDRAQTFASIAPYTIEEAYEVADAIERQDMAHLREELGDLLFQVVFHAQMAREAGAFDFEAVAASIREKLVRRHPHVFAAAGPMSVAEQSKAWEEAKAQERRARAGQGAEAAQGADGVEHGALSGVPRTLPALMRAHKLSKRAARVGFDFEHASQTADKVAEELEEVRQAAAARDRHGPEAPSAHIVEEVGDLLFAAANLARKLDVDAESALRAANEKFERRFRAMETLARQRGLDFAALSLEAQERLWLDVKRAER